jgi:formate dehydrogenase subunit gamma
MPAWSEARGNDIIRRHAGREGAMLPILHDMQAAFGHVPAQAVPFIADALNLTRAEVHGVVTFYHDFRDKPAGRHVLKLCRAEACQSVNGEHLARQFLDRFGVEWGGTTPDGRLTIEATYCLGLCASGPSAMLDGEVIGRLTKDSIDDIAREVG